MTHQTTSASENAVLFPLFRAPPPIPAEINTLAEFIAALDKDVKTLDLKTKLAAWLTTLSRTT